MTTKDLLPSTQEGRTHNQVCITKYVPAQRLRSSRAAGAPPRPSPWDYPDPHLDSRAAPFTLRCLRLKSLTFDQYRFRGTESDLHLAPGLRFLGRVWRAG